VNDAEFDRVRVLFIERRKMLGLSQREVGDRAGVSQSQIATFEAGKRRVSPLTLQRWAQALRITFDMRITLSAPEWPEPIVIDVSSREAKY